ncbi:MAG: hypothetical protein K2O68_04050 [Mucispirillum sp.]|nr:hypothetical protein [Mucispirillum sp.]
MSIEGQLKEGQLFPAIRQEIKSWLQIPKDTIIKNTGTSVFLRELSFPDQIGKKQKNSFSIFYMLNKLLNCNFTKMGLPINLYIDLLL